MSERRLVRIPNGPANPAGLGGVTPGASAGRIPGRRPVSVPRVRLATRAPDGFERQGGVTVDGRALAAGETGEARAALRVGNAVQRGVTDLGEGIADVARRVIIARESAELMEADSQMSLAWEAFNAEKPADPNGWAESWRDKANEVRESLLADPDGYQSRFLKKKLQSNLQAWEAETGGRLSSMAIRQHRNIADVKSRSAFSEAVEREDLKKAAEISAHRVAMGISTREVEAVAMRDAQESIARNQLGRLIDDDPWEAEEILNSSELPWMTPADLHKAKESVKIEKRRTTAEEAEAISGLIADKPELSESALDSAMEGTHLTAGAKRKLKKLWRDTGTPDFDTMGGLRQEILGLTARSPFEEKLGMQERIFEEVPARYQGQFRSILAASTADHSNDAFSGRFRDGVGIIDTYVDGAFTNLGGFQSDPVEAKQAKIVLSDELALWLRNNPDASNDDMFHFLKGMGVEIGREGGVKRIGAPGLFVPPPTVLQGEEADAEADAIGPIPRPFWIEQLTSPLSR